VCFCWRAKKVFLREITSEWHTNSYVALHPNSWRPFFFSQQNRSIRHDALASVTLLAAFRKQTNKQHINK